MSTTGYVQENKNANPENPIYWSDFEYYETCPQKYLWVKGWPGIDLGAGVGLPKPRPLPESRHHALMGTVIQKAVEWFYQQRAWEDRSKWATLEEDLLVQTERFWHEEVRKKKKNPILPERLALEGLTELSMMIHCKTALQGFLRTVAAHKLIGVRNEVEFGVSAEIVPRVAIGGRLDQAVWKRMAGSEETQTWIFDGKNSKNKNADPDQLRWYALIWRLSFGKIPERMAFIYYRYPFAPPSETAPEGVSGLDEVPCTEEDLKGLALRVREMRAGLDAQAFDPTPSPTNCKYCPWETTCTARVAQRAANSHPRAPKEFSDSTPTATSGVNDVTF